HHFLPSPHAPPALSSLSLHDALPIFWRLCGWHADWSIRARMETASTRVHDPRQATFKDGLGTRYRREGTEGPFEVLVLRDTFARSEEHTSELQSLRHLVCRLLLEKKK